jgi:tRNA-specific 2-thiouridylase
VGDPEGLLSRHLTGSKINWLIDPPESEPIRCITKIRYRHPGALSWVRALPDHQVEVTFDEPQSAITPGQAVVFYDADRVLGGGWIETN